ncbi:hypothetical protein PTRA_a2969 [Pseudoalteromonas translucida KMM 520]|uniref:Card1 endonuclease domain-containing protein n=1 Tax=Pseudoalteromonas translucida KMM 520 TaxID=1315283 RepID=A0A0U2X5J8_9GAMM|nr:DUF1887 family CARF protein [Pseudoalteromonas translucida]ALS34002.1 hypothetical protein PTRA_a2969 [Pseudoalteromonas translucida KMM 520]
MKTNTKQVTHICLIGEDPTANLTPIIDKDIPSDRVIIAHEKHQQEQVEQLKKVIQTRGYKVDKWLLPTTFNTEEIKLNFMQLFEQENTHPSDTWLNASNGSRYQILAAYEVARAYDSKIYIVEPKYDALCWLSPENREMTPVADKIKLHEFLSVNGFTLTSQQNKNGVSLDLRAIGENWLKQADKLQTGLAKLNYLAQFTHGDTFIGKEQDIAMLNDESLQWLLNDLEILDLIKVDGKSVHFQNEKTRFFANGGWLEEITFSYIRSLSSEIPELQDNGHSVEIERSINGKTIKNELDVVALVNNKLHVIECKTKKFKNGEGSNMLYKIDSLAERLGGLKCKAALVTFFPLNKSELARANELNIEIFVGTSLKLLKNNIKNWLQK